MRFKLGRVEIALCSLVFASLSDVMALSQDTSVQAKEKVGIVDESLLTIDRIFANKDFDEERLGQLTWSKNASYYYTFKPKSGEPSAGKSKSRDLVRIDCESGAAKVIATDSMLVPAGKQEPIAIDGFEFSADETKVLIYTNSQRVWRRNTRGDYWLLDLANRDFKQLGGEGTPATMMFAKFSPDGKHVAFVRENNLYSQQLTDLKITALTTDGSGC